MSFDLLWTHSFYVINSNTKLVNSLQIEEPSLGYSLIFEKKRKKKFGNINFKNNMSPKVFFSFRQTSKSILNFLFLFLRVSSSDKYTILNYIYIIYQELINLYYIKLIYTKYQDPFKKLFFKFLYFSKVIEQTKQY
jgi:hypothetical protein